MKKISGKMNPWSMGIITVCCVFLVLSGCTSQQPVVQTGDTVRVHYTVSFTDGTVFQSNMNGTPLEFTVGNQSVIAGFNEAVVGMSPGQTKTVTIPVDKAYGPVKQELINVMDTDEVKAFIEDLKTSGNLQAVNYPEIGPVVIWQKPDGNLGYLQFRNITTETTTVDENHPLAGKDLVFEITLVEIVEKTGQ